MAIPSAIYFDTDCLQDGGEFLNSQAMPQLLVLARGLGIQLHVTQLVLDERVPHLTLRWTKDLDAMRRIEKSIGEPIVDNNGCRSDEELIRIMTDRFKNRLSRAGFTIVPNSAPSLDQLISHAIAKKAPFEPRGKGFCDTIIVESIVSHAVDHYRNRDVLVVSRDGKFREGIQERNPPEVRIISTTLEEAPAHVAGCREEARIEQSQQEESTARRFLEANKAEIFTNAELQGVSALQLKQPFSGPPWYAIECVLAIRPLQIGWVQPTEGFSARAGDRTQISFGVDVEVDLMVRQPNAPPELCSPTPGPTCDPYWDSCYSQTTVEHFINFTATAAVTANGRLDDLQIMPTEELYGPDATIQHCR